MKYFLVLILFMGAYAQEKTIPNYTPKEGIEIYNATTKLLVGDGGDGVDTTAAFRVDNVEGAIVLYWVTDTTGASTKSANQSDSCLIVNIQLRPKNGTWSEDGYKRSAATYTKLDTVDRAQVNTATTVGFYTELGLKDQFAPAYEARLILQCGVGDSLYISSLIKYGF